MVALAFVRALERVLFAGALFAATGDLVHGILLGAATSGLHVAHSLVAVRLRISTRASVEMRSAAAVLASDPMAPLASNDLDVFATFLEGTELIVRLVVDVLPGALGDLLAAALLGVFVARLAPAEDFVAFFSLAAVGAVVAIVARRATASRSARAWEANGPFWQQLRAVLGARHEIVASGVAESSRRELSVRVGRWSDAERRYRLFAGATGRLPLAVVGLGVALVGLSRFHRGVDGELLREVSLFAGVGAPLASLVAALHEAAKSEPTIDRLLAMTSLAAGGVGGTPTGASVEPLTAAPTEIVAREVGYRYAGASADALSGASFAWRRGRLLAIAGKNGAGKSTLLRMLLRLAAPSSGGFEVSGEPWGAIADESWRRSVSYVAQNPYLDETMTVRDLCHLLAPDAADAALEGALRRVDVWDRLARQHAPLDAPLRLLSAGMRQRVVLARALAQDRPVLLLDEPDASLDADGVRRLAALLRELAPARLIAVVAHSSVLLDAADDRVVLR